MLKESCIGGMVHCVRILPIGLLIILLLRVQSKGLALVKVGLRGLRGLEVHIVEILLKIANRRVILVCRHFSESCTMIRLLISPIHTVSLMHFKLNGLNSKSIIYV
jgi:hypothetical protein